MIYEHYLIFPEKMTNFQSLETKTMKQKTNFTDDTRKTSESKGYVQSEATVTSLALPPVAVHQKKKEKNKITSSLLAR